jgi:lipopolysaccharide export system permease protein
VVGLLLAFVLAFAYHVLMAWGERLGQTGRLPPLLAAWAPNAAFAILGVALLFRQE